MAQRRKDNKKRVLKEGEYQRTSGTYEYKWTDKRGRRHSVSAPTLEELRDREDKLTRDTLDGLSIYGNNITINDLYRKWKSLKKGLKDNTFRNYQYMYTQFVADDIGDMKVCEVKRSDIRGFYNRLSDERHLKAMTIDSVHTVLHQILELAVDDDYIRYNPSDKALTELKRAHCNDSPHRRALTREEQDIFERFLRKPGKYNKWYPVFTVMLWTGMRVGEVTGLRWEDIDLEKGTISVNHTLVYYDHGDNAGCTFGVNTPKTRAGKRVIPMLPVVRKAFLQEKQNQTDFEIECKAVVDGYTDFIFVNRFGNVQNQLTLNRALKRIIRDCNYMILDKSKGKEDVTLLPNFSNHSLRHTFTTRMCEAGVNLKAMQEILGHTDVQTTLNIYTDATMDLERSEMTKFEEYFAEAN